MGEIEEVSAAATVAVEQALSQSSSPSASSPCGQYMLHRVGKIDTHAGVVIKYGVEVKRREYCWLEMGAPQVWRQGITKSKFAKKINY
jgi:hypothetical protein